MKGIKTSGVSGNPWLTSVDKPYAYFTNKTVFRQKITLIEAVRGINYFS